MEVVIDNRETKIKEHFQLCGSAYNYNITYDNLDIGDIIIKHNGNSLKAWDEYSNIKYGENDKLKNKIANKAKRHIYNTTNKLK